MILDQLGNIFIMNDITSQKTIVDHWFIVGNQEYAFAINMNDETEIHCFDIDPEVNNNAYIRAQGWAYPGEKVNPLIPSDSFFKRYLDLKKFYKNISTGN